MAGYAARTGPHGTVSGELHPLEVGAVALVASQTAVVVVADLLQVDDDLALAVRTHVAEATGTSPDLVWVCATHTHSGPFPQEIRLARVAAEARRRWPDLGRIALWHRTGGLAVTEVAVVVAVSAPHRDHAFDAARWAIDEVKATAPIWKREHWDGGHDDWGRCDHRAGHDVDGLHEQRAVAS